MKNILAFTLVDDWFLFEDEKISKLDNESLLTKCLEAFLEIDDFWYKKN